MDWYKIQELLDDFLELLEIVAIPTISGIVGAFIGMGIMRALGMW